MKERTVHHLGQLREMSEVGITLAEFIWVSIFDFIYSKYEIKNKKRWRSNGRIESRICRSNKYKKGKWTKSSRGLLQERSTEKAVDIARCLRWCGLAKMVIIKKYNPIYINKINIKNQLIQTIFSQIFV